MRSKQKKTYIIIGLCLLVLLMSVGYAAFSTVLNINGTAEITTSWDVEITNVVTSEKIGNADDRESPTFTYDTATLMPSFVFPGDSIKYSITVSNLGSVNAVIDSAKLELDDQNVLIHTIEGLTEGEVLNSGASKTFTLTIKFSEEITSQPNISSVEASLKLHYLQAGNSTSFSDATYEVSDSITINSLSLTPSETSITAKINTSTPAYRYYYSLDGNVWYESSSDEYTINGLSPNTRYTVYVKTEDSSGEVVTKNDEVWTTDVTAPKVDINIIRSNLEHYTVTEGNVETNVDYEYYKGIEFGVTATDNDEVSSIKYCVFNKISSGPDECTPTTNLPSNNTVKTAEEEVNGDKVVLCVKASDRVTPTPNEMTKCTKEYKIDAVSPTLTDMDYSTSGNSVTLKLFDGNDNPYYSDEDSGIFKYLFSKDGTNFVRVTSDNYTFTNLEDGTYIFYAKVIDKAGNVSETISKSVAVRGADKCGNVITNLANCIIANEAGITGDDVNATASKAAILAKGTPDFTKTSPGVTYVPDDRPSLTQESNINSYIFVSQNVSFDQTTGYYNLQNYTTINNVDLSTITDSNSYYTCHNANIAITNACTTVYEVVGASFNGTNYYLTEYARSSTPAGYDTVTPGTGLYAAKDYDNSDTYYFRGAVESNYVKFGKNSNGDDLYWRIIRVNGDGTIRLIYDGTSAHASGQISADRHITNNIGGVYGQKFNERFEDNARVGYMYGNASAYTTTTSTHRYTYNGLSATQTYYFGSGYTETTNSTGKVYTLTGNVSNSRMTLANFNNNYFKSTGANYVAGTTYYTCASTSKTCAKLFKLYSIGTTNLNGWTITYASQSYNDVNNNGAHNNITSSAIKTYLESWYGSNLTGYGTMISNDTIFCNNRKISTIGNGTFTNEGYGSHPTMYGRTRFSNWDGNTATGPTLECLEADRFTVNNSTGNGMQLAPIGLITADEVNMAGGEESVVNVKYYLYTGSTYWTMSPSTLHTNDDAYEYMVDNNGVLINNSVNLSRGVRPVINLNPKAQGFNFSGIGTIDNPYVVS